MGGQLACYKFNDYSKSIKNKIQLMLGSYSLVLIYFLGISTMAIVSNSVE